MLVIHFLYGVLCRKIVFRGVGFWVWLEVGEGIELPSDGYAIARLHCADQCFLVFAKDFNNSTYI